MLEIGKSITDTFIDYAFKTKIIDSSVENIIGIIVMLAIALGAILYFLSLAYNYGSTVLRSLKDRNAEFFVDYEELARTLIILACIVLYLPIANALMDTVDFFNSLSAPGTKQQELLATYAENYLGSGAIYYADIKEKAYQELLNDPSASQANKDFAARELMKIRKSPASQNNSNNTGNTNTGSEPTNEQKPTTDDQSETGFLGTIVRLLDPGNWIPLAINATVLLLTSIVKIVVASLTVNVLKVLFCIGPLAFAFSILPAFKNQVSIWFGTVLNVAFVFTTMNILDHLSYSTMDYLLNHANYGDPSHTFGGMVGVDSDNNAIIAFNLTILILYTMSFWLTSKFVGKSDGGRVLTKAVGIAAAAIGAGIAAGAGSAASSGNIANAASAAKNIIEE
jgi:hypothetical protein